MSRGKKKGMSDPLIRPATSADAGPAARLCKKSLAETYGVFLSEDAMQPWIEGGLTDGYASENIGRMLVAEDASRVIGICVVKEDLIDLLWVDRDRKGQGVGGMLMVAAEERMRSAGFATGRVECFRPNTQAIAFYESHGYQAKRSFHAPEANVDKVELHKAIGPA